jgi:quercetin dioxygenase-like cupin family protein
MPDGKEVLLRHIAEIAPVSTSHGVGEKRVVATREEVGNTVTQIARTRLKAGEEVEAHVHPTMDEHFFFLEGECEIMINGVAHHCLAEDYLFIPAGHKHAISVKMDTIMITIGLATE